MVNRTASGASDGFIAKYGPNGALEWVNRMGHGGADFGTGVAVDSLGNTFVAWTYAVNTNNTNAFIYKYNANGVFQGLYEVSSTNREVTHGIAVDGKTTSTWSATLITTVRRPPTSALALPLQRPTLAGLSSS